MKNILVKILAVFILLSLISCDSKVKEEHSQSLKKIEKLNKEIKELKKINSSSKEKITSLQNENKVLKSNLAEMKYIGDYKVESFEVIKELNSEYWDWYKIPKVLTLKIKKENNEIKYYSNAMSNPVGQDSLLKTSESLVFDFVTYGEMGFHTLGYKFYIKDGEVNVELDFQASDFNPESDAPPRKYVYKANFKLVKIDA